MLRDVVVGGVVGGVVGMGHMNHRGTAFTEKRHRGVVVEGSHRRSRGGAATRRTTIFVLDAFGVLRALRDSVVKSMWPLTTTNIRTTHSTNNILFVDQPPLHTDQE